jgi:hypothetical protein
MNDLDERNLDSFLGKTWHKVKDRRAFYYEYAKRVHFTNKEK